jgi:hypothetical protein
MPDRIVPLAALLCCACCLPCSSAAEEPKQGPALGLSLETAEAGAARGLPDSDSERSVYVRLRADWRSIERQRAVYDWSKYAPVISDLERKGYRTVLSLAGSNPLHPQKAGSVEAWLGFVRSAVRSFAGEIEVLEIVSDNPDPAGYAFLLKSSAIAARAEARAMSTTIRIAQAPVPLASLEWQREVWSADSAAYIDVLPLSIGPGIPAKEVNDRIEEFMAESLLHPPASELWAHVPAGDAWNGVEQAVRALSSGVAVALVGLAAEVEPAFERAAWLVGADRALGAGYAPAPLAELSIVDEAGVPPAGAGALGRFFSGEDFSTLIFYSLPGELEDLSRHRMLVDSRFVRNARILDPMSGRILRVGSAPSSEARRGSAVRIAAAKHPLILLYQKGIAPEGLELPPEEIESVRGRELTAEEIIARHQQVQKIQDDTLERWTASARIDFHFKFAQWGGTIDVSIDSNHFWERGGQEEWEQTAYYLDGNKVRWKNIPELPFFQPEKVITLPLDLTLDKTYLYRSAGRDRVKGRDAYVLEFEPADPDSSKSLYRGKVWIDRESFVRLKISVVQTNLEAPVISSEESDTYRAVSGPAGTSFWLIDHIDGQQIWTIAGNSFVVRREVAFLSYEINPPVQDFNERRAAAYSSNNQMLRDTPQGLRYLERQDDGSRSIKEKMDRSQLFAAAGAFKDNSTDGIAPLAGVNYFNFDLFGKGIQFNALYGGLLAFVTASKPDLFGKKMDATVNLTGIGIKLDDKVYSEGSEVEPERIRQLAQYLSARLGFPAGPFFKFSLIGGLSHQAYFQDKDNVDDFDAARARSENPLDLEFVLPQDHLLLSAGLQAEFNRRGYSVSLSGSRARRSEWEEWGLFDRVSEEFCRADNALTECVAVDPEPVHKSFTKWSAVAYKEWYFAKFQGLRGEIDYVDGADLDRFSRYGFSRFGPTSLRGFSGSGVRFDRGAILKGAYSFNIFETISFSASLESARVELKESAVGSQSFTGLGLSGRFFGPWKTIISLSFGCALDSDIPELEGETEYLLFIFKLF